VKFGPHLATKRAICAANGMGNRRFCRRWPENPNAAKQLRQGSALPRNCGEPIPRFLTCSLNRVHAAVPHLPGAMPGPTLINGVEILEACNR